MTVFSALLAVGAMFLFAGCQTTSSPTATAAAPAKPKADVIRIKAGSATPVKDAEGNVWLADQGFADGDTIERPDAKVENTKSPQIYQSEHYSMSSFSRAMPNGKYTVKLHFAETYEEISAAGQRVFSFNVGGHEYKDFDVFAKAGGALKALIVTVDDVQVTNGKLEITFTTNVQNPQINGIEIIPMS